jgi:hypothetical protein
LGSEPQPRWRLIVILRVEGGRIPYLHHLLLVNLVRVTPIRTLLARGEAPKIASHLSDPVALGIHKDHELPIDEI